MVLLFARRISVSLFPNVSRGRRNSRRRVRPSRFHKASSMRKTIATAIVLYSSATMVQSTDTKSPASTSPAAQSDSMSKATCRETKWVANSWPVQVVGQNEGKCTTSLPNHRNRLRAAFLFKRLSVVAHTRLSFPTGRPRQIKFNLGCRKIANLHQVRTYRRSIPIAKVRTGKSGR